MGQVLFVLLETAGRQKAYAHRTDVAHTAAALITQAGLAETLVHYGFGVFQRYVLHIDQVPSGRTV